MQPGNLRGRPVVLAVVILARLPAVPVALALCLELFDPGCVLEVLVLDIDVLAGEFGGLLVQATHGLLGFFFGVSAHDLGMVIHVEIGG
ncbi:hypothetical protein D3C86_1593370 [compost metagenome]